MALPQSAVDFLAGHRQRLRAARVKRKIVFPEGDDARVLAAAGELAAENLIQPILIGRPPAGAPAGLTFIDPAASPLTQKYAALLYERRRARGLTQMEAAEVAGGRLYFAALMVTAGDADGTVGSAVHTTADTVRAAIHSIDMRPGFRRLSSVHVMAVRNKAYGHQGLFIFTDAAIIIQPTAVELAEIALAAAETARALFDAEPVVALLSFSTKGSARHKEVDRVLDALRYIRERAPDLHVDGELQADAALVPAVGQSKAPGSTVAGYANTLIFPDLNSANIGYKLVERLGDGALLAVLLQGIARPANIVSRGCAIEDIVHTAILTAVQAERASQPPER
ncbi:MAG: phosphate acyltransferase [Acidobacteriota bacterium]